MSAGTVILWRHGRTEFNATSRLQGTIDVPLDEVGRWQVERDDLVRLAVRRGSGRDQCQVQSAIGCRH